MLKAAIAASIAASMSASTAFGPSRTSPHRETVAKPASPSPSPDPHGHRRLLSLPFCPQRAPFSGVLPGAQRSCWTADTPAAAAPPLLLGDLLGPANPAAPGRQHRQQRLLPGAFPPAVRAVPGRGSHLALPGPDDRAFRPKEPSHPPPTRPPFRRLPRQQLSCTRTRVQATFFAVPAPHGSSGGSPSSCHRRALL
jgi:hypothetical protein